METKPSIWSILYKYKFHHVLGWLVYFAFWVAIYMRTYPTFWHSVQATTLYFTFQAPAFYITAYYLFPNFLFRQRYVQFALLFLALALALALPHAWFLHLFLVPSGLPEYYTRFSNLIPVSFVNIFTMVGILTGAKVVVEKISTTRLSRIREQQRLESELQFLRAQINPHFLFNTINSVYFLIKKDPDKAAETLIKLSDLLRFQLYDCSDDKIAIEKETEYLRNFITLEKIRRGQKVQVNVDMERGLSGFHLSPFVLIPFVENAFKHVSSSSTDENKISIKLQREGDQLHARIENTTEKNVVRSVGGIGLKNVRRRLELLYPDSHELTILEEPTTYSVQLTLKVT